MIRAQIQPVRAEAHWYRFRQLGKGFHRLDEVEQRDVMESMVVELAAVVQYEPAHARAHCRLAGLHLRLFNSEPGSEVSPFSVRQVREAALASHFESAAALKQWLSRAFAGRYEHLYRAWHHAHSAVRHSPLQGKAYLYLAELCFLEGQNSPGKDAYIRQALKVRPLDASVSFEAGHEALLAGDPEQACRHWQTAFHTCRIYQSRVIRMLAAQVPARSFLEMFKPDGDALELLAESYRQANRPDDYRVVLRRCAAAREDRARSTTGEDATEQWLNAAKAYEALDEPSERLRCLEVAVQSDLSSYSAHHLLGACCYELHDYSTAAEHLNWCLQRRPQDRAVRALAESAINKRLRLTSRPVQR